MSYILKGPDDKPILRDDKEVFAQDFTGEIKGINLEKRTLTIIGTDETRDRDGDIIRVNGWMLENYLKNPVFLWAHNYSSVPLGATSQLVRRRSPSRLEFNNIRFPTEGLNPFADMILHLYEQGIINASSVGFLPYKWQELEKSENVDSEPPMWRYGREFVKQELLELSGCPVPSNPSALQNAIKNFAGSDILTQNMMNCFEKGIDNLTTKDDILEELYTNKEIEIIDEDRPTQVQVPKEFEGGEDKEEKGVCGSRSLPTDDSESWDGAAARSSIETWATSDGEIDFAKYKKGFVYQDDSADAKTKGAYKLPFAKVSDGSLKAVWGGVGAAMGVVNGARGGANLGDSKKACYSFLVSYYKKFDKEPPVFNASIEEDELKDAEVSFEGEMKPLPNEHACRLVDPSGFSEFRRGTRNHEGKEYSVIYGKKSGEDTWAQQSFRYKKDTWTAAEAGSHCKNHDGSFEPASGASFTITVFCEECEKTVRENLSTKFGVDLSEKEFSIKQISELEGEEEGKTVISYFSVSEGKLILIKEEILDGKSEIPEGEGETKQEFTLSQADKEWLVETIKEILQAKEEIPAAKAPQEPQTEKTPESPNDNEMKEFMEAMGRLKQVANEIKEVVENATH